MRSIVMINLKPYTFAGQAKVAGRDTTCLLLSLHHDRFLTFVSWTFHRAIFIRTDLVYLILIYVVLVCSFRMYILTTIINNLIIRV